jgi:hypothetical protein
MAPAFSVPAWLKNSSLLYLSSFAAAATISAHCTLHQGETASLKESLLS